MHRVEGLRFKDGTTVETDLVVMAAGVRPNIGLAKESGIDTNRAILVNDHLGNKCTRYLCCWRMCGTSRGSLRAC